MLTITVVIEESFDQEIEEFIYNTFDLTLEHSLVSLSKWESRFEKPFLGKEKKTNDEVLGYIYEMILTPGVPPHIVSLLSDENIDEISRYMDAKMTATWFQEVQPQAKTKEVVTSELIYYWMTSFNIPYWPAETWHLNRLFTLIKVCNAKNAKPKKMSSAEARRRQHELNKQRRAQMGTSG